MSSGTMGKRKRPTRTAPRPQPAGTGTVTDGPATKAERTRPGRNARALQRKMERRPGRRGVTTRVVIFLVVLGVAGGVLLITRLAPPRPAGRRLRRPVGGPGDPARHPDGAGPVAGQHRGVRDGTKQVVPGLIGISTSPQVVFSPLHTHDTSGTIPLESPAVPSFTLGEFFDVWEVRLTPTRIGGYCTQATGPCGCTLTARSRLGPRHRSSCSPTRRSSKTRGGRHGRR